MTTTQELFLPTRLVYEVFQPVVPYQVMLSITSGTFDLNQFTGPRPPAA